MSTLKTNTIQNENGSTPVDFPTNIQLGNGYVVRVAYSQASDPSPAKGGDIWWDTSTNTVRMYLSNKWYTVN